MRPAVSSRQRKQSTASDRHGPNVQDVSAGSGKRFFCKSNALLLGSCGRYGFLKPRLRAPRIVPTYRKTEFTPFA